MESNNSPCKNESATKNNFATAALVAFAVLLVITLGALMILRQPSASAATQTRANSVPVNVVVTLTCSMSATEVSPHTASVMNGQYAENVGNTKVRTLCNDNSGYALYMIGYTGNTEGNNYLRSSVLDSSYDIVSTATTLDGTASDWGVKLTAGSGDYAPTVTDGYTNYGAVTSSYQRVAQYASYAIDSDVNIAYKISIGPLQPASTYTGKVKYIVVHPETNTDASYGNKTFQNVSEWGGSLLVGESANVTDERDGKSYTVARLCMKTSGTCSSNDLDDSMLWMTQNLDLQIGATTLDSTNTDINTDYGTLAGYSTSGTTITWTPSSTVTTPATISGTTVSGWTNSATVPYQAEGGDGIMYKGTYYADLATCQAAGKTTAECLTYQVGNYYNWTAAVAMNNTSSYTTDKTVMSNSICPKGWRLPNGLTTSDSTTVQSEFNQLLTAYGLANGTDLSGSTNVGWAGTGMTGAESTPLYFARSGLVADSSLYSRDSTARYWSSTVGTSSSAYILAYNSRDLYPAQRQERYYGFSVRCVSEY